MRFASDYNLRVYLPAALGTGRGEEETRKRKITLGEKEASVLGFSLAKRPCRSGTTGKKDKEDVEGGSGTVEKPAASS